MTIKTNMKIQSVKMCFEDLQGEIELVAKHLIGPSLKDSITEVLDLKRVKKIKNTVKNVIKNIK